MEEGSLNVTGLEEAKWVMRDSEFYLHPAGDTSTSCRLFGAIASLASLSLSATRLKYWTTLNSQFLFQLRMLSHQTGWSSIWEDSQRSRGRDFMQIWPACNLISSMVVVVVAVEVLLVWYGRWYIRQAVVAERRKVDEMEPRHVTCLSCLCTWSPHNTWAFYFLYIFFHSDNFLLYINCSNIFR
jgi:hypothetical protein